MTEVTLSDAKNPNLKKAIRGTPLPTLNDWVYLPPSGVGGVAVCEFSTFEF